jgi:hypothetical protein
MMPQALGDAAQRSRRAQALNEAVDPAAGTGEAFPG